MSENTKNEKVVVVANLKSPMIGFVLALFLGWLGVDRFYKGGILSILLGIIKLILGVMFLLGFAVVSIFIIALDGVMYLLIGYIIWYVLDLILVPLGIVLDNRRKMAIAKNMGNVSFITKNFDFIQAGVVVGVLLLGATIYGFIADNNMDTKVATAKNDAFSTQKAIVARVFAYNIDITKPKAPNGKSWGEWIIAISELNTGKWAVSGNGIYPKGCNKETPLLWINPKTGDMHFNPSKLKGNRFCETLRDSYAKDKNKGDKVIPLKLN